MPLLLIPFFLVLTAQSNKSVKLKSQAKMKIYTVNSTGPFTIKVDGKELLPSEKPEPVTLKTSFIRIDQKLNIYSYANNVEKGEILLYKNNKLIKNEKGKFPGLKIIQVDELGNWAGYIINKEGTALIIQNAKQVKVQKIRKGEIVVGITKQSDVATIFFDSSLSQAIFKKNGVQAKLIKLPEGTIGIQVVRMMANNPLDITSLINVLPSGYRPRIPNRNGACPEDKVKDPACVDGCGGSIGCIESCPCISANSSSFGGGETIPSGNKLADY